MNVSPVKPTAGFTLVEVLIGMTLSLMIMGAVLSSYVFLGRNFTRSLGLGSANQPTLESQSRRALAYFEQDVRMATDIDNTGIAPKVIPSASGLTLKIPTSSAIKYVTYYFNATMADVAFSGYIIPAQSLVRIDPSITTAQILHTNLLSVYFRYFDSSDQPYDNGVAPFTTTTSYLSGIKQISISFSSQGGDSANGTQTQLYSVSSPRLILRNRQLLP